ncbi:hypothetical protein A7K93_05520 [Candidatus Methylacidiphilum fumarolicum]|nr:hypothetical protein A7K73_09585 [Candidatus Methylacidiphilum fumarolicum]TFE72637.1 hypothetical protein A7K72_08240 [Candidatus Methylacidiphilum fumarolicum]TFE73731.1 hypothetical protein A7K93_05520 [Candidatus Methylacidiphilum fumarolicum]TFE74960.1 hypothetical protein A7D33_11110 [Candidatus Methylacidiphilum fumarolicum]
MRASNKRLHKSFHPRAEGGDLQNQWEALKRFCLTQSKRGGKRLGDCKQRTKLQEKEFPLL